MTTVPHEVSEALRDETPLPSEKPETLHEFTLSVVRGRGNVDDTAVRRFLDVGYTRRHILELVLGLSQKVMSKYTSHGADTPIDEPFKRYEWHRAQQAV